MEINKYKTVFLHAEIKAGAVRITRPGAITETLVQQQQH